MANHFQFNIRVYIEDTDAGGIVYHANHIRFMERARTEWLRSTGIAHYWHQKDYSFVVHQIQVKYTPYINGRFNYRYSTCYFV